MILSLAVEASNTAFPTAGASHSLGALPVEDSLLLETVASLCAEQSSKDMRLCIGCTNVPCVTHRQLVRHVAVESHDTTDLCQTWFSRHRLFFFFS